MRHDDDDQQLDDHDDDHDPMTRPWPRRLDALLVALVAAAYAGALGAPFHWDDHVMIVGNARVHSLGAWADTAAQGIRPLLHLTYALNWMSGFGAMGFHAVNVVVHAVNALLVVRLARSLGATDAVALGAALLFALHPIQTEAVTYVCGRSVSLMTIFYVASVLAYVRDGGRGGALVVVSAALYALAVATREVAIVLPVFLVAWEASRGPLGGWCATGRRLAAHGIVGIVAVLALAASPRYRDLLAFSLAHRAPLENLLAQLPALGHLASRLVLVHRLTIDPAVPVATHWTSPLAVGALGAAVVWALANLRRRPLPSLAATWCFVALLPTNTIVARADVVSERHAYLPAIGVFLVVALGWARLRTGAATVLAAALVVVLGMATVVRNHDYRSEIALWNKAVALTPTNARAFNNLGFAYQGAGCPEQALVAYRTALRLDPGYALARTNLESATVQRAFAEGSRTCPEDDR